NAQMTWNLTAINLGQKTDDEKAKAGLNVSTVWAHGTADLHLNRIINGVEKLSGKSIGQILNDLQTKGSQLKPEEAEPVINVINQAHAATLADVQRELDKPIPGVKD